MNLLSMSDMWRSRAPPTPLDFDKILDGSFSAVRSSANINSQSNGRPTGTSQQAQANGIAPSDMPSKNGKPSTSPNPSGSGLKDQRQLTLKENLELFVSRFEAPILPLSM
jgi:ubiquitin-like 1-activating enzyme E1 B